MPGGSTNNNWRSSPRDSLTLQPQNSFTIPRSHNYSSDESDSGLRSGEAHGASHPGGLNLQPQFGHDPRPVAEVLGAPEPFDDPPFVPHRNLHRNVNEVQTYSYDASKFSPATSHHSAQSNWSNSSSSSGHSRPDYSRQNSYSSSANFYQPGLEHGQYEQPNAANAYYRTQSQSYNEGGIIAPEIFHDATQAIIIPTQFSQSSSQHSSSSSSSPISASSHPGYSDSTQTFSASPNALYGPASSIYPDAGPYLRQQLGLSPHDPVNLSSLPDPPLGEKPNQPLPTLIKLAIYGSPRKQLTLQEIYTAIESRFEWFRLRRNDKAWRNSIRHNLSLNKVFRHVSRPITEPGKGSYWQLDVSEGEGYKRARKRRNKNTKTTQNVSDDEKDDDLSEGDEEAESQEATSFAPSSSRSPTSIVDETNIDPELRGIGHVVGEGRSRSLSRRPGTNSPYPSSGSSQSPRYGQGQLPSISDARYSNQELSQAALPPADPSMQAHSAARFGQPSFGQPSFGQTIVQAPTRSATAPTPFPLSSPTSMGAMAGSNTRISRSMISGRNAQIVQPQSHSSIRYMRDDHSVPNPKRVPGHAAMQQPASTQGYISSQELLSSADSQVQGWQDPHFHPSRTANPKGQGRM